MSKELAPVQANKVSLFNKTRTALEEVGIDLDAIVSTYEFFINQQKEDPELKIPTYRVKIPSSGGKVFEIITGDEEYDVSVPSFRGVVASFHNCNALFEEGVMGEPPLCQSADGIRGAESATGALINCADCPRNQWGSDPKGGRGKACKNSRRLYILVEGSDMPIVMTLPPTSIAGWEKYKSAVLGVQRRTPQEVVTEFSLAKMKSAAGVEYSVVQFKAVGVVGKETKDAIKALNSGDVYDKSMGADDYNTAPPPEAPANIDIAVDGLPY